MEADPLPEDASQDLFEALRELHEDAGAPSLRDLSTAARGLGRSLAASTDSALLKGSTSPTRKTIAETLREVQRCTKDGITINTFMLERSKALADFVALITRLNRGRAFYAEPEHLGEYVLVDFVSRRTKHVS